MFDEASDAVCEHMFLNCWNGFQDTKLFQKLAKKLKSDPDFIFSRSIKKMKLRYNIKAYKALNEGSEYVDKIQHPNTTVERLLKYLLHIFYLNYNTSAEYINIKKMNSTVSFQKFEELTSQLQKIDLSNLKNTKEQLCFFLNTYNLLSLHGIISNSLIPHDKSSWDHHQQNSIYLIGGSYFSLSDIFHGILRANTSSKSNSNKHFKINDDRAKYSLSKIQPMIHFATIDPYRPTILKIYRPKTLIKDLKKTTTDLLQPSLNIKKGEKIVLPKSFQIYEKDFQIYGDILNWISIFFEMKLMSNIFSKTNFKFTTYILKYPKLIIDFDSFSLYRYNFLK
ncbi:electron carrier/ protein disulfide oxidoreductase [Anaeramoeba flamelloides]|uniref:Electron carrier/ protein disulfide oxidoreductase n=1 Tax=Anaeramoeba flamelloides TaxID=1746091 RepID=A0AAV7Y493_9EUKA|nr:electron carrier/ protein disulfide oxidoreductase [Anaeramoeba flamelloides]